MFLPLVQIRFLFDSINDLSNAPVKSPNVSTKFGDVIEGAPISTPTNLLFLSNRFESHELCESPARIRLDWELLIAL